MKTRQANEAGVHTVSIRLGERATQRAVVEAVESLNANPAVHGPPARARGVFFAP